MQIETKEGVLVENPINSLPKWVILKNILKTNFKGPVPKGTIARTCELAEGNPYLYEIFGVLFDIEAMIVTKKTGNATYVKLDYEKIHDLLRNNGVFEEFSDYEEVFNPYHNY